MGGFFVPIQPFGIYQALDWLCSDNTTVPNIVNATRRIRNLIEKGKTDDIVRLGIVSRLIERLEKTNVELVQVRDEREKFSSR
jgi:hypothetical protein